MKLLNPLAQSFYVEHSNGMFVTSIDLYFYRKDNNLPVTVQLRPMELGQPSRTVYPFGEVVLSPSDIETTEFGIIPTRVTFPSPVYLTGNQFHSIVISSNSDSYLLWIAEMGQVDSGSDNQVIIDKQPLNGGLFKSQNSSSWIEEPYQDLKFKLYRANFTQPTGDINFYSPELSVGNSQIANLTSNSFEMDSRFIRIKLDQSLIGSNLTLGNTVEQDSSDGSGDYVGSAGSATGSLNIINGGIGYVGPATYFNASLVSLTGTGADATADIEIDSSGVAIAASITSGGSGYVAGDVLTVETLGGSKLGRNLRLSLVGIAGTNELLLDNVQGEFKEGVGYNLKYINNSGISTFLGSNIIIPTGGKTIINDGLHIKVNHKNHGNHSPTDRVSISNVVSDIKPITLTADYDKNSTGELFVNSTTNYGTFENLPVSFSNPGYVAIDDEIISYNGTTATSLTGITRGIDGTKIEDHFSGDVVGKYELNSISLRRINKTHRLEEVTLPDPIGLDYYYIKLRTGSTDSDGSTLIGVDRSVDPKLYIKESKSTGGEDINATQNIQYNIIRPTVQTLTLSGTTITPSIRTVSGRSIDGSETSFEDNGFESINLDSNNYLSSPRAIFSKVNESVGLNNLPGNKSLTLNLQLFSGDSYVSPTVDLDRVGLILTSNRVNKRIENYSTDDRVSSLEKDPTAFTYASNIISLEVPATSIKLLCTAYVNTFSDLRAFYSIQKDPYEDPIYFPFPGFNNLNNLGQTIDESLSDGNPDRKVQKVDLLTNESPLEAFREYEFTENNLESFRYFSIKLVGTSTNQAYPPRIKDLRVIAVA